MKKWAWVALNTIGFLAAVFLSASSWHTNREAAWGWGCTALYACGETLTSFSEAL